MTKILVTGASGFVGSALCDTSRARGIDFLPAVRQATQSSQFAVGDLSDATDWTLALSKHDVVLHLAARVHVMNDKSSNPLTAFRAINVDATMNLAKQAARNGIKRFVYVSSVKVNGEATIKTPFTAFDQPAPLDPYGQSKLEAEMALRELSRSAGMEIVVVRPPLVYGPGVRANFRRLMQLVKLGIPLPLGAIHNSRSMVSLDNLVDLLITCSQHPDAAGETFMVSDDCDVSVADLLRMLSHAMGKRSLLLPIPSKIIYSAAALAGKSAVADRLLGSLQVDIAHTKTVLQWKPVATVQESLAKTVAHFMKQH